MAALARLLERHLDDACMLAEDREGRLSSTRRRALRRLATCGDPHEGFVWWRCTPCGVDRVLAMSCKTRLLCPRCGGRRMSSTAVHLVERVLPDHRLRQWVATFPSPLPRMLAWCPELLGRLLADLSRVIEDDLRLRTGTPTGRSGMVSFIQSFTGDLRCFVHVHALVPDGVFVDEGSTVRFVAAPHPTRADLQRVTEALAARVQRSCTLWRRRLEPAAMECANPRLDALGRLGEQAVGIRRVPDPPGSRRSRWLGRHGGVELHAGVTVKRGDRKGRERLVRYVARPALSLGRIALTGSPRTAGPAGLQAPQSLDSVAGVVRSCVRA